MVERRFVTLFLVLSLFEMLVIILNLPLRWASKPLIMISLIIYFWYSTKKVQGTRLRQIFLAALVFALLGDIFLLVESWFVFGLGSFLIMQALYAFCFLKSPGIERKRIWLVSITLIAVLIFMNVILWPYLGDLGGAVLVYTLAITFMTWTAFVRPSGVIRYTYVCLGAILFLISDSIIALNQFHPSVHIADWSVMATYIPAQLLIVLGYQGYLTGYE